MPRNFVGFKYPRALETPTPTVMPDAFTTENGKLKLAVSHDHAFRTTENFEGCEPETAAQSHACFRSFGSGREYLRQRCRNPFAVDSSRKETDCASLVEARAPYSRKVSGQDGASTVKLCACGEP